ncbi:MAG TPA: C25 family cysteine peptidase, partial [Blastocatellia bacterium]|nr:C25 family cysteine peptidase [Blastocatellia bacterium]
TWLDRPRNLGRLIRYWIEDIDVSGASFWTGPISADRAVRKAPANRTSALVSQIGLARQLSPAQTSAPLERNAAPGAVTDSSVEMQSRLARLRAIKLGVKREGWYRVGQPDLIAAGLDPSVDPQNLQMYVDGRQIPIRVQGEQDRSFDANDSVEFYGVGLDSASTDERIYWLISGSEPGIRIKKKKRHGSAAPDSAFQSTVERKDRTIYVSSIRNGDVENFFGPILTSTPVSQAIRLSNVAAATRATAALEIAIQGLTTTSHEVAVRLNGRHIGDLQFSGQTHATTTISVSQSLLTNGDNDIQLVATGGPSDISLVDSVRVTYWHAYIADANSLIFTASGGQTIRVEGFSSPDIEVMDITDTEGVRELVGVVRKSEAGSSVTASVPGSGTRLLFAVARDQAMKPLIETNIPSDLRTNTKSAGMLIITRAEFAKGIEPLRAQRENQGLKVEVVDVEDIYDEFSFGMKQPSAIREFLTYARTNWKDPPRFALLVGDSSIDPRNYLGYGDRDLVPTRLIDTANMETASDDWFIEELDGPADELSIGRLPARTAQEAGDMVTKIVRYESAAPSESLLLAFDSNDGFDFAALGDALTGLVPSDFEVQQFQRVADDPGAKAALIAELNRGAKVVNYYGHGSVQVWRADFLTDEDALALQNRSNLSLFVLMTCLNGYFADPALDCLAESLMKGGGGGIAVWASSAMCDPLAQKELNEAFYRELFGSGDVRLGDAVRKAKATITDRDVRNTWIFFGDPSMKLK